jgi:hypothetical protein
MMRVAALVALVALGGSGAVVGCDHNTCMSRGTTRPYTGSAEYHGLSGAVSAVPAGVRVDDFDPFAQPQGVFVGSHCDEQAMAFTVHVGPDDACTVWAAESGEQFTGSGTRYDPSIQVGASAAVEPSSACTLPFAEGRAAVSVSRGTLTLTRDDNVVLTLEVTALAWPDGGVPPTNPITWSFASTAAD